MVSHQDIVLLFTRYPIPGESKTRLIPVLGDQGAAELQRGMTEHAVAEARHLTDSLPCMLEIHYCGGDLASMRGWLGYDLSYRPQTDGHIGVKMGRALAAHLGKKQSIILLGSDLPGITSHILAEALQAAKTYDLTIGPAHDGGYYLIGVNGKMKPDALSSLFSGISWGTPTVFAETMAKADIRNLTYHILPKLHDIDRPEDLGHLHHRPDAQ